MTKIRSGSPKPSQTSHASKAEAKKPAAKKSETKQASGTQFPRTAWKDSNKLEAAITKNKDQIGLNDTHPRLQHAKKPNGGHPTRPPVVMRYGVIRPPVDHGGGGGSVRPPIAMRYGVIRPPPIDDGGGNRPPIAMRYGLIRPGNR